LGNVSLVSWFVLTSRRNIYAQSSTLDHQSNGSLQPSHVRRRVTSRFLHSTWCFMLSEYNTLACFECLDSDLLSCRSGSPIRLLSSNTRRRPIFATIRSVFPAPPYQRRFLFIDCICTPCYIQQLLFPIGSSINIGSSQSRPPGFASDPAADLAGSRLSD